MTPDGNTQQVAAASGLFGVVSSSSAYTEAGNDLKRIVGPPGCGKTTWLSKRVRAAAEQYGPQGALVCSLTKAAAREAGGREDLGILDPEMVGTLHAHAYRALGRPRLFDAKAVQAWNAENPAQQLSGGLDEQDETGGKVAKAAGDRLLARYDLARARRVDPLAMPADVAAFGARYRAFKADAEVVDFTDLIELAIHNLPLPPHGPSVIYVDEAQDLSRLELELVESWIPHVEHVRLVGDADQALYCWRGADPAVLGGVPDHVLSQSYRVPAAVHEVALQWIGRSSSHQPIEYRPTSEPGAVSRITVGYRQPEGLLPLIEERLSAGESVMLLGACSYMLDPVCKVLRSAGIPYHNPYAARWNPLTPSAGLSARDRVLAFVRAETLADFKAFVPLLRTCDKDGSGPLVRGAKAAIEDLADDASEADAARVIWAAFKPEALPYLNRTGGDLNKALSWFADNLLPSRGDTAQFPLHILRQRGIAALEAEPEPVHRRGWVVVGTAHSVKGGEADVVVVWPDLSPSGWSEMQTPGWAHRDAIWRLFYVAATRARRELVIGAPSGGCCVQI